MDRSQAGNATGLCSQGAFMTVLVLLPFKLVQLWGWTSRPESVALPAWFQPSLLAGARGYGGLLIVIWERLI